MPDTSQTAAARLSMKDTCALFDLTPRSLRHYEYIELIFPEREGRSRFYPPRQIARLKLIMRGRRFGFSLEQIRQWLEIYDEDPNRQLQIWIDESARQIDELEARKRDLEVTIEELKALRAQTQKELRGASHTSHRIE